MLDEEWKNAALSDKKQRMWVHKYFRNRKSEAKYWTLYIELADDKIKCYQYFRTSKHQFNYVLQKIIFVTCILHNFLNDQGVGLSDMGSSANVQRNLKKIPKQGGCAHQSYFDVRDKFKQSLIVCVDLCFGGMKECNVRLMHNQLSWMLS